MTAPIPSRAILAAAGAHFADHGAHDGFCSTCVRYLAALKSNLPRRGE